MQFVYLASSVPNIHQNRLHSFPFHQKLAVPQKRDTAKASLGYEVSSLNTIAVKTESDLAQGKAFFPVNNSDYRAWRQKHKKGCDMLVFSNVEYYRLGKPMIFNLNY